NKKFSIVLYLQFHRLGVIIAFMKKEIMPIDLFIEVFRKIFDNNYLMYKDTNSLEFFTCGGCYNFANLLKERYENSRIYITENKHIHCVNMYNNKFYDISGELKQSSEITKNKFVPFTSRDVKSVQSYRYYKKTFYLLEIMKDECLIELDSLYASLSRNLLSDFLTVDDYFNIINDYLMTLSSTEFYNLVPKVNIDSFKRTSFLALSIKKYLDDIPDVSENEKIKVISDVVVEMCSSPYNFNTGILGKKIKYSSVNPWDLDINTYEEIIEDLRQAIEDNNIFLIEILSRKLYIECSYYKKNKSQNKLILKN
ncbi:MAG: hypothetical protein RSB41_03925, partial [Bacilli bacterium]